MDLIELHILQSFPVTCLNRDDVGAPKTAVFGGCPRARVSSQCWKRAIRTLMKQDLPNIFGGERSRFVVRELEGVFQSRGYSADESCVLAGTLANAMGKLDDPEKGNVKTLLYFSPGEFQETATAMLEQEADDLLPALTAPEPEGKKEQKERKKAQKDLDKIAKKAAKALKKSVKDAADISIFGRMVADDASLSLEGAGLFSHALSTHPTVNEIDFFAAVDDRNLGDSGAGHIGTLEFNSACYYRYVGLNLGLLKDQEHLGHFSTEELIRVKEAFVRAALQAVPPARKNSMFGFNPPAFVLGLRRMGQPLSLVNAFESPVQSSDGYVEESVQRLKAHWENLSETYCLASTVKSELEMPPENLNGFISSLIEGE